MDVPSILQMAQHVCSLTLSCCFSPAAREDGEGDLDGVVGDFGATVAALNEAAVVTPPCDTSTAGTNGI